MEESKLFTLLGNIAKIAKQGAWVPTYNKTLDYFSWSKPLLSEDSRLVKISHDVFLYFNKRGTIEGLDIEYLNSNFIEHNPSCKEFPKLFTERTDGNVFTVPKEQQKNMEGMFPDFAEKIRSGIYEDAVLNNQGVKELEDLVDVALKS